MNQLYLKWDSGEMLINLLAFFPTSVGNVKKLLGIIKKDTKCEDHIQSILNNPNDQFIMIEEDKISSADDYLLAKQSEKEYKNIIDTIKHPNGTLFEKNEIKVFKIKYWEAKRRVSCCKAEYEKCIKIKKCPLRNMEHVKEREDHDFKIISRNLPEGVELPDEWEIKLSEF